MAANHPDYKQWSQGYDSRWTVVDSQQSADVILHNGRVLTVDTSDSIQQALALRGEDILAVGRDQDVLALSGPGTDTIDLRGRTVIPGIIDIHAHMDREGLKGIYPSLEGARSIADIQAVIRRLVARKRHGEWVVTMPIGDPPNYADAPGNLREGRFPTRWELDQVSPHNPVYIKGIWTSWNIPPSVSVANSLALNLASVDRSTPSPDTTVTIDRDASGEPTGVFIDNNRFPTVEFTLMRVVPRFTHIQRVEALKESMRLYSSVGITGIYEGHGVASEVLRVYKEVWDAGEMAVRAHLALSADWRSVAEANREMERWAHAASGGGFGDSMLRISGYFITYLGSRYIARARSAELPYTGWAGFVEGYNTPARFRRLVRLAAFHNLRVNTQIRDSLEEVLSALEEVHQELPIDGRRWTLVHTLHATQEQLRRIQRLGLVVETIPLTELWLRGFRYLDNPHLADTAVAHRSYLEQGVPFGFGTDNKSYNPFVTLWSAMARTERRTGRVLGHEQKLSRLEALRAFTIGGAYFSFDEGRRGYLEPGKLADLAVLSYDFLSMPEEELPSLRSLLTMVGGKVVHQTGEL